MTAVSLQALQESLRTEEIDGFLVPKMDPFRWEDTADEDNLLQALTGFTGSAGLACVLKETAAICVDGRYTLQVRQEVDATQYHFLPYSMEQLGRWVQETLGQSGVIGYDPWLHSISEVDHLTKIFNAGDVTLKPLTLNPILKLWTERPSPSRYPIQPYAQAYAGQSVHEKLTLLRDALTKNHASALLLNTPDSISWVLNIRCPERPMMPGVSGYLYISTNERPQLFVERAVLDMETRQDLETVLDIKDLADISPFLRSLHSQNVMLDAQEIPQIFGALLQESGNRVHYKTNPCLLPKACKNKVEIDGARQAQVYDGAALVNCFAWLEQAMQKGPLYEMDIAEKLLFFREQQPLFQSPSFASIVGSGPHGAIIHYHPTFETNRQLEPTDLLLIDSGGQYLGGTTDTTRTLSLNKKPTRRQQLHFTAVLKGHIALATARFPDGVAGHQLDGLARQHLWQLGVDYAHGTGHGVGSYLGVHEGPQRISSGGYSVPLKQGMICSNEPGYYEAGAYGMRLENLVLVVAGDTSDLAQHVLLPWVTPSDQENANSLLGFETLTVVPFDTSLILKEALTPLEIQWLNAYHAKVAKTLMPLILPENKPWLEQATRPI